MPLGHQDAGTSIKVLCPFFDWFICSDDIKPRAACKFWRLMPCLWDFFSLYFISIAMQKFLKFIRYHVFIFVLVSIIWGDESKVIHKNKLKMNLKSKCEISHYKTPRGKCRQNTL